MGANSFYGFCPAWFPYRSPEGAQKERIRALAAMSFKYSRAFRSLSFRFLHGREERQKE